MITDHLKTGVIVNCRNVVNSKYCWGGGICQIQLRCESDIFRMAYSEVNIKLCCFLVYLNDICKLRLQSSIYVSVSIASMFYQQQMLHSAKREYEGVSKSFRTQSVNKYTLTFGITRWEATQKVMAAKLTILTHKIAIQLHLVAESCTICRSRPRRPDRKLLETRSYNYGSWTGKDVAGRCRGLL
jgi:hypothetical protein